MSNVQLLEMTIDIPDELGVRSVPLNVTSLYRASFSIQGAPGDVVNVYGSDGSDPSGEEYEFGLGVLEYGDTLDIGPEIGVQFVTCSRVGGQNSGSKIFINGSSYLDGNAGVLTSRVGLDDPNVPDLPQTPSAWVDIAHGIAYQTVGFQTRRFSADDEVLIEATDSSESTICVLGKLKGVSDHFDVPGNYPKVRVRRVGGTPSDAGIRIVGIPYGPTIGTPPISPVGFMALADVNGVVGALFQSWQVASLTKVGVGVYDINIDPVNAPINNNAIGVATLRNPATGVNLVINQYAPGTGAFRVSAFDNAGAPIDANFHFVGVFIP